MYHIAFVRSAETQVVKPSDTAMPEHYALAAKDPEGEGEIKLWIITTTEGDVYEFAVEVDADIDEYPTEPQR